MRRDHEILASPTDPPFANEGESPRGELAKPEGYELDEAFLKSFIGLSEALTGVKPLDKNLAGELMDRYARHKLLSSALKKLIDTYRSIAPGETQPSDAAVRQE
jgi:hypothetical protein